MRPIAEVISRHETVEQSIGAATSIGRGFRRIGGELEKPDGVM